MIEFIDKYRKFGPTHTWEEFEPESEHKYRSYDNKSCYKCKKCGIMAYPEPDYDNIDSNKEHIVCTDKYMIIYVYIIPLPEYRFIDLAELYNCKELQIRKFIE